MTYNNVQKNINNISKIVKNKYIKNNHYALSNIVNFPFIDEYLFGSKEIFPDVLNLVKLYEMNKKCFYPIHIQRRKYLLKYFEKNIYNVN